MSELGAWLASQLPEDRTYILKYQPSDFAELGEAGRLYGWLTDFGFVQAKVNHPDIKVQDLIDDYDIALGLKELMSGEKVETLRAIQGAVRKSAHILAKDITQLAGQLLGRLLDFDAPEIQAMLEQAKQWRESPWLRPLTSNLERPGEGALQTLEGHTDWVSAVAIAPDGKFAVSASRDKTLKIWDLTRGTEVRTLKGHTHLVKAVAIAPDGKFAVSASFDNTLKIWDWLSGQEVATFSSESPLNACAVAPDGVTIVAGDESGRVLFLRLEGYEIARHG